MITFKNSSSNQDTSSASSFKILLLEAFMLIHTYQISKRIQEIAWLSPERANWDEKG